MKSAAGVFLIFTAAYLSMPRAIAEDSPLQRHAVLASFQGFLDGLGSRDKAAMTVNSLPGGAVTLMRDGKPLQMTLESLIDRLSQAGTDRHEERINHPLVKVDGNVAIVWAYFEFLINGKVDHCGRDVVSLVKTDGRWLIAAIADNSRMSCARN